MDYEDVALCIIEEEKGTIGKVAVLKIKKLDFISAEDGEIEFTSDIGSDEIEQILDVFQKLQGDGAYGIARRSLQDELGADDNLDLPEKIVPEDIKAEQFVGSL